MGGCCFFVVAEEENKILGFLEFRISFNNLFLNHIYIIPAMRGCGIGKQLLFKGIQMVMLKKSLKDLSLIELDVFFDNKKAIKWYNYLGFSRMGTQLWVTMPLHFKDCFNNTYCFYDLPQAEEVQKVYGFSMFQLQTKDNLYQIGRIGSSFFRSTNPNILDDFIALKALRKLDRKRLLLCIGLEEDIRESKSSQKVNVITKSYRYRASLKSLFINWGLSNFNDYGWFYSTK